MVHSLYPPFAHYLKIILRSVRAYGSFELELPYGRCWKSNHSGASWCGSQTPLLFILLLFLFFLFMDYCFMFTCCTLLSATISLNWDVSLIITYITCMPYCFPAHLRHCHPKCDLWGMLLKYSCRTVLLTGEFILDVVTPSVTSENCFTYRYPCTLDFVLLLGYELQLPVLPNC